MLSSPLLSSYTWIRVIGLPTVSSVSNTTHCVSVRSVTNIIVVVFTVSSMLDNGVVLTVTME